MLKEAFVEIRERDTCRVVTAIELLSPTNKNPGPDRELYLSKRLRYSQSDVHLVEIDLLRGGHRMPVEGLPACDCYVQVSRVEERPSVGLWPIMLRDPLPTIPIPLLAPIRTRSLICNRCCNVCTTREDTKTTSMAEFRIPR